MGSNYYWEHGRRGDTRSLLEAIQGKEGIPWRAPIAGSANDEDYAHVCKISGGGVYCFDCRISLVTRESGAACPDVLDACPGCGKTFDDAEYQRLCKLDRRPYTGVAYASHITWAQPPENVKEICRRIGDKPALFSHETSRSFTGAQFLEFLERYVTRESTDSIGSIFS